MVHASLMRPSRRLDPAGVSHHWLQFPSRLYCPAPSGHPKATYKSHAPLPPSTVTNKGPPLSAHPSPQCLCRVPDCARYRSPSAPLAHDSREQSPYKYACTPAD
ncbi:hypothetical protein K438DRAFT_1866063 [Mycena galopus ATCC 62051]|nr:hypothetical protein K438DRAFT_1866063 [Mycena galopus ATCC 62051]